MATNVGLHLKPRDLGYRCLVSEAWYHFAPDGGCQKQAGKQDSNMMVRRDRNILPKFKDPGVWTFRITCAAKVLKLHKETKNRHQLESTEIRFPRGRETASAAGLGQKGFWALTLCWLRYCLKAGLQWEPPFGGVSHLLTVKQQIPRFQSRNKSSRPVVPAFGRHCCCCC